MHARVCNTVQSALGCRCATTPSRPTYARKAGHAIDSSASTPRESALVVVVPEAEQLVGALRLAYDSSAARGVPAHITLLYPFVAPERLDDAHLADLRAFFASVAPFAYTLARCGRFPHVLYLAPEPAQPFVQITQALAQRYPDNPPYGGAFADVIPHLTVAESDDTSLLDRIAADLDGFAPLMLRAEVVTLMVEGSDGRWVVHSTLPLGG